MPIWIILYILFFHWFADFVLQTDKQAKGKSSDNKLLFHHVSQYTIVIFMGVGILGMINIWNPSYIINVILFFIITFIAHFCTDYVSSRIAKYLLEQDKIHNFFVVIGFDQFLHYTQLLITIKLLFLV